MEANRQLLQKLQTMECRGSTYWDAEPPLVFARGRGSEVFDAEGRRYLDFCAGFGVLALGHNHPALTAVLKNYCSEDPPVIHAMGDVYPSRQKVELFEALKSVLPGRMAKGFLALSGSQAVEVALKTAMLATGRSGVIYCSGAYHGLDFGSLPLTSWSAFKDPFLGWTNPSAVEVINFAAGPAEVKTAFTRLRERGVAAACLICEPVQGRAGVIAAPGGWLQSVADLCHAEGSLFILDEIMSGLGRTGFITASDQVDCDLICLGKSLGGGLPLSACFGTQEVMDAWPQNQGEAIHTGTFFGHPLSCALGAVYLSELKKQDLAARSRCLGETALKKLHAKLSNHPLIKEIRGRGLMIALEFTEPLSGAKLMDDLRQKGVIALASGERGESLTLTPALNIPEAMLDHGLETLIQTLTKPC